MVLKDEADVLVSKVGQFRFAERKWILAIERDFAAIGPIERSQQV